jgi:hypothetical protein
MNTTRTNWNRRRGFTLIEVMIALTIFFAVSFVVLGVVSSSLRTAQALRIKHPDAGIIAGDLWITNKLEEGVESGSFGRVYPDYEWSWEAFEAETNGLWQVDITIFRRGDHGTPASQMSIQMYRPQWQTKRLGLQP